MPFSEVPAKVDFVAQELDILKFWKENNSFAKMREVHRGQPTWSFIDGPITANNPMGVHHGWGRTYKDLYNRFWTMRGHELRYQQGFDCQGLWVEVEVEKELGFQSKKEIEEYGLDRFVNKCKERVLRYSAVQTEQSIRLGYWMDWNDTDLLRELADRIIEDPRQVITVEGPGGKVTDAVENMVGRLGLPELGGSYYTFSTENNYMIWKFLKLCWEKKWLYRGADVMPWCPRCATGISQHEIVTDGYVEKTHPSVTLRLPLREKPGESLLVWTTTPWTLTSNVMAAVGPELTYVKVRQGEHVLYLSKGATGILRGDFEVLEELPGTALEGYTFDGPFDDLPANNVKGGYTQLKELVSGIEQSAVEAHRVILWDEVGEAEGTGIVHMAPGCGAEDFAVGRELGFPIVVPIDEEGHFVEGFDWLTDMHVDEVMHPIFERLREKGIMYHVEDYTHRYPVCWRCGTDLVFRLVDEWFISMDELRYDIMDVTRQIRWIPSFGLERELDWLRNMHDWMISKKRFWGLALPIWECEKCGAYDVIGDEHELESRATEGWSAFEGHTPHRPWIDSVKIKCPECGGVMSRIKDVGNPWLDAGIVGFSTLRYRADREYWEKWYPADWISESFPGQFRNWFYSLLALSTALTNRPPFMSLFGYALLYGEDGRPMHKSWGNAIEFNEAANNMGVDVMRWLYCAHKPENNLLFGYTRADEVRRRFLIPLWNVYNFFVTYANIDGWEPHVEGASPGRPEGSPPKSENLLDRWILARLHGVVAAVTDSLENYDAYGATMAIEPFLDDLTNWYVRRSRRRFWKSEHDADKDTAYSTLYYVLCLLSRTLAPITPFITEVMYQNLVRRVKGDAYESVHHCDWPTCDDSVVDAGLLDSMALAIQVASLGRGARGGANVKLRQPLAKAFVYVPDGKAKWSEELTELVADELNVKEVGFVERESDLVTYRLLPDNPVLGPKFGQKFPKVRKALSQLDAGAVVPRLRAGLPLELEVEGETLTLQSGEVIVQTDAAEGLAVAADRGITVAVDTVITPELKAEGLAREVVRRVQTMRKDAGFRIEDYITTYYRAEGELADVMKGWEGYIKGETLSGELVEGEPAEGAYTETHTLEGMEITIGVLR